MEKTITAFCNYCIQNQIIQEEDREVYEYSFFVLGMSVIYYLFCFLIMVYYQCFLLPIIFTVTYQLLRSYMGGWHAPNVWLCTFLGLLLFTLVVNIFIYNGIPEQGILLFSGFSIALTAWVVHRFGVQDHPNRSLTTEEKAAAKQKCFYLLGIIALFMLGFALLQRPNFMLSMALACFSATVLHLFCQISMKKGNRSHETH